MKNNFIKSQGLKIGIDALQAIDLVIPEFLTRTH